MFSTDVIILIFESIFHFDVIHVDGKIERSKHYKHYLMYSGYCYLWLLVVTEKQVNAAIKSKTGKITLQEDS